MRVTTIRDWSFALDEPRRFWQSWRAALDLGRPFAHGVDFMLDRLAIFRVLRRSAWLIVLIVAPTGCVKDYLARWRGPGFDENTKRFTSELPQRKNEGKPHSFSTKAREIESNFGFE